MKRCGFEPQGILCGICDGQSSTGIGFSPSASFFLHVILQRLKGSVLAYFLFHFYFSLVCQLPISLLVFFSIVFSKCFCLFVLIFYIDRWTRMNIVQNIQVIIAVSHTTLMLWLFIWTSTKQQQCPHAALNACDSHQDLLFRLAMPSSSPSFFCRWKSFRVCKVPFEVKKNVAWTMLK